MSFRSRKLLDQARGQACTFCLEAKPDVVSVHLNSVIFGKGVGVKCPDSLTAWGCQKCHDLYDGRIPGWSHEERLERFAYAYFRTMMIRFEQGLVKAV